MYMYRRPSRLSTLLMPMPWAGAAHHLRVRSALYSMRCGAAERTLTRANRQHKQALNSINLRQLLHTVNILCVPHHTTNAANDTVTSTSAVVIMVRPNLPTNIVDVRGFDSSII